VIQIGGCLHFIGEVHSAEVTRTALRSADLIFALMLNTEALVTQMPEKEKTPSG
jgi:hypothetical protein